MAGARSARMRHVAERSRLVRPLVDRFIAGALERDAVATARRLTDEDLLVTLDYLGEDVMSADQARATVAAYRSILKIVGANGLGANVEVSLKLSAVGQSLGTGGEQLALDGALAICAAAAEAGTTVTLDAEDYTTISSTLKIHSRAHAEFPWLGIAIQAYLKRAEADCQELARAGCRVRLCKGAYVAPESASYKGGAVSDSYRRCLATLLSSNAYPMIATHDPAMIDAAKSLIAQFQRSRDSYEFQLLYGVRPEEQRALSAENRVRVYVPYGDEWYPYFMRRLAERPANLRFFVRAAASAVTGPMRRSGTSVGGVE